MSSSIRMVPTIREVPWLLLRAEDPLLATALSPKDWDRLETILAGLQWQHQPHGDIAEHSLDVAMIVSNRPTPAPTGRLAAELVAFLTTGSRKALFQRLFGGPAELCLRRAQANRMVVGSYNHFHRDTDDDPDYCFGVLLYPCDPADYEGGEICFEGGVPVKPTRRSLIAFRPDVGHSLQPLVGARASRISLVLLFGEHAGPNRRFAPGATQ